MSEYPPHHRSSRTPFRQLTTLLPQTPRFYSGPLRGIFSNLRRLNILRDIQVLVLDGLSVTADLVHDILTDASYSVRILSLRECKHLNERKLRSALQYACRASRPEGTPRLKGLYIFGKKADQPAAPAPAPTPAAPSRPIPAAVGPAWNARSQQALATSSPPAAAAADADAEPWYGRRGWQLDGSRPVNPDWAQTLVACDGVIAFDAVLCTGPRHLNSRAWGAAIDVDGARFAAGPPDVPQWGVAVYSLGGCAGCGCAPEGWTVWGDGGGGGGGEEDGCGRGERRDSNGSSSSSAGTSAEIGRFPLLRHAPLHSANVKVAMCPSGQALNPRGLGGRDQAGEEAVARFIPRCAACLRDRYCTACHRWWCESCYAGPWAQVPRGADPGGDVAGGGGSIGAGGANATGNNGDPKHKVRDGLCYVGGRCWIERFQMEVVRDV